MKYEFKMFEKLFESPKIKKVRVKKRISFPSTGLFLGGNGCVTQTFLDFYEKKSKFCFACFTTKTKLVYYRNRKQEE